MAARVMVAAFLTLLVTACGGGQPTWTDGSQAGPSPIVLQDTSPSQLSVTVLLSMGGYDAATRDQTLMDINFQNGGRPVKFVAGERVTCGQVVFKLYVGGFETRIPTDSIARGALTCTYSWGQQSSRLVIHAPNPLKVVSPVDHQQVARGPQTAVRYVGASSSDLWVVALSPNAKAVAQANAITATNAVLDTTALTAGDGSIALTDPLNIPLPGIDASQFRSVSGFARRMTMVPVVWV